MGRSGKNRERRNVFGPDDREVPSVQCCDDTVAEPLGKRYDGSVDGAEGQIAVSRDQLGDPYPVPFDHRRGDEVSCGEIAEEPYFCRPAEARLDEVGDFGDDELRYEQWPGVGFEEVQTRLMVAVVLIDIRVEGSGIDDQRDRRVSCRMISSMRRAVSRCPLRPALAASRRRPEIWPT